MSIQTESQESLQAVLSDFQSHQQQVSGTEPVWLSEIRKEAIQRFEEMGYPHAKQEEWRFTNIRPITSKAFHRAATAEVSDDAWNSVAFSGLDTWTLAFINGRFVAGRSSIEGLPDGVVVSNLADALQNHADLVEPHMARLGSYEDKPFAAINTALMQDGAFVYIPKGVSLEKPIQLLYYTTPGDSASVTFPRNLIVAASQSESMILENIAGTAGSEYLTNSVNEIVVGDGATVQWIKLQRESESAYHLSSTQSLLGSDSNLIHHNFIFGGSIVRNDIDSTLDGENTECTLNGLYMGRDSQLIDNHTNLRHEKPNCNSWEMYKGILGDKSHGIFKGRIFVQKDAQKTDAKQTSQGLLLSPDANLLGMPQLEIYADDVKCTHGATTGRLEEKALFYCQTRGIPKARARILLTHAFAAELINQVPIEPLRETITALLDERLAFDQ